MLFKRLYQSYLCAVAGALLLGTSVLASAQGYPSKAVKVIIPFPPGGPTDTVGRMLAQKLSEETGQSFIVENRPGGQGVIGGDAVAKSAADGYTLLFSASTFTTTPMTLKSSPYDVVKDFTPIALVGKGPLAVSVNKKLPIRNIKELISYAQAHPGKMSFAIGSQASAGHLSTELLKRAGKIDYLVVPYKGSSPAYQDLIGGAIDGFIDPVLGVMSYHKSGMVRVVAVTSRDRLPSMPDVPTVAETVPGYEFYSWYGLWGPSNLPADVTKRLNAAVNKALASDLRTRLAEQGYLLSPGTPEDFARFQKEDMVRSAKIVAEAKIRAE
ncbi:tripartite tricarboxylate transporter substrate binding protein [Cupriavidus sp. UYPR2.512]|uniref:Bug family tripartite tricarboxylate transporter substrate binding protein n=1 Tax=Cupriavidus sp. UYPR2.512 TaxID=1080187 RepID=UPI00037BF90B|nr:tripartite tricarboxylate transporter substrate binding protein [Cupriavidus sp. UYPR2.512]UIF87614.1 tripartite tricarboxylate transporter substrate binding protein [Cupriavidus necator]